MEGGPQGCDQEAAAEGYCARVVIGSRARDHNPNVRRFSTAGAKTAIQFERVLTAA